ncbi:MAG: Gfo/Idh/MocA family oxidoreductase [Planctomycetaceae bacterium]|nr:Gfo/Idh/MocA family oxidoreductase [Planctomycetaceae bacterium]
MTDTFYSQQLNRRDLLKTGVALSAATLPLSQLHSANAVEGTRLRTAHIGVGGMGGADLNSVSSHSQVAVTALCDVDSTILAEASQKFPSAKTYSDFRQLFAEMADSIDAVVVSTPDHTHAPAAMMALNHNKPVYCQKPLTHDIYEARQLRLLAEQKQLPTQMGIQVSSSPQYRGTTQLIQEGVIGKVSQVYVWSHKNWGYDGPAFEGEDPIPETLKWDLWLGTAAARPYKKGKYHRSQWRRLIDFGTGTLGDMGVHICDTPYRALQLTAPSWAKTTCRPPTGVGHPEQNLVEYEFPGTDFTTETLSWKWSDGAAAPPDRSQFNLPESVTLPNQAALFVGEKGTLLLPHVADPQVFIDGQSIPVELPKLDIKNHYHEWVDACLNGGPTISSFSYGGPLTEALLLGVVANRFPGQVLKWDADQMQVTNLPEANELVRRNYREGFEVHGL